jgi:GMP synthase (glutamine-hydrolysing)
MRLHFIQQEPFEYPANILTWAKGKGFTISATMAYKGEAYPDSSSLDWLIIMGGSMGVHDEKSHGWLLNEKRFIEKAIRDEKKVIGICLGAQLISHVLGGKVYSNEFQEIGWFPVKLMGDAAKSQVFKGFPATFTAFHWHGDTFEIPKNAVHLAESEACRNQAFDYASGQVVGLQLHIEVDKRCLDNMAAYLAKNKHAGKYVQSNSRLLMHDGYLHNIRKLLFRMLDNIHY